ncbi:MAG: alpha/beta hydrolase domain-containing protein, partial [Halioglobus sp.]|nr:alpha/beta hydrolase domain-containing protein [Halioglobus sp.]
MFLRPKPTFTQRLAIVVGTLFTALLQGCSDNGHMDNKNLAVPGGGNDRIVSVPAAQAEMPPPGETVLVTTFFTPESVGYEQHEYIVAGTAQAYINANEFRSDGRWEIQPSDQSDYRTRIVEMRPADPAAFNGTVVLEWLNVSAGFDSAPDWGMLHTEMIRSGYAWVGVSAQREGVAALLDGRAADLLGQAVDDRYTTLFHPGDAYSYDIYSQVAQALRSSDMLLGGLVPQRFIAAGESQSAHRLMTYVNAFAPIHALFDGYFIHSRIAGSAALQGNFFEEVLVPTPPVVNVRTDLRVPVMMVQTETDLF